MSDATAQQLAEAGCQILVNGLLAPAPFVVTPTLFSRAHYQSALALQSLYNSLVAELVTERHYLQSLVRKAAASDPSFVGRLYDVAQSNPDGCCILFFVLRSDYMIDGPTDTLLQVELNTVSCANGALSSKLASIHHANGHSLVPDNRFLQAVPSAFSAVHQDWLRLHSVESAVVLFIVPAGERNVMDHQLLIDELARRKLKVCKCELSDKRLLVDGSNRLLFDGQAVSIVYFRSGYAPHQYSGERCWTNRALIERSTAAKVPNVMTQLCGMKLVQQALCDGVFIRQHPDLQPIVGSFSEQLSVADYGECLRRTGGDRVGWVLKPQREGGGNNVYGTDVLPFIERLSPEQRPAYTLQRLIRAPVVADVRANQNGVEVVLPAAVSELGIFGVYHATSTHTHSVSDAGWLVRTKDAGSREGGLVAGFSFLDAPLLTDQYQ